MDSHTHSVQRLEIVDTGRRRRWTDDEKRRIIEESCVAPRQISATARRHGISASQLFAWRRTLAMGPLVSTSVPPPFVPVRVELEPATATATAMQMEMEIVSARGTRIFVDARLDKAALAAIITVLEDR
jgi:transposase